MEFSKEQKIEAYKKLSEKEKDFIASEEATSVYKDIGTRNGLLLDDIGKLSDIVLLVLIGLLKSSDLKNELKKVLGLSDQKTESILAETNEKIFVPFRNIMVNETQPVEEVAVAEPETFKDEPSKDQILSEIENPTPVVHPISAADQTVPGPATPREVIPEPAKDQVSKDFVAGKLAEPVNMPTQKSYAADPYREPLA